MNVVAKSRADRSPKDRIEPAGPAQWSTDEATPSEAGADAIAARTSVRRRALSPLTLRILALNVLALAILVGGLLYLGEYRRSLVQAELEALTTQGRVFAGALGESAVFTTPGGEQRLDVPFARQVVRRLVAPTRTRARLFDTRGELVADSRALITPGGEIRVEELPPPETDGWLEDAIIAGYERVVGLLSSPQEFPLYQEKAVQSAADYSEVLSALTGEAKGTVRATRRGVVISYAVPVQRLRVVVGAIMLSTGSAEIDANIRAVRLDILKIFAVVLTLTVLLSFYLAGTIANPIRRLANAAHRVRRGQGRKTEIPDFTRRGDEIGDLSAALRQMTDELWDRMESVERFAADVAHEIKNPLSSLRSAVETANKVDDPERKRQLMAIIQEDVQRLDRLITDISRASRLDAELSRSEPQPVNLGQLVEALTQVHEATAQEGEVRLAVNVEAPIESLYVNGIEDRLVQVLQNLLANAMSFSPADGVVTLTVTANARTVTMMVDDLGPGIPEGKLGAVFDRFYSERPAGERFGRHSGLGLSISKQIVDAHDGAIRATNRRDADGRIAGARFEVQLPRMG